MAFAGTLPATRPSDPNEMEERTNPQERLREQFVMRSRYEVREWADSAEWEKRKMNRARQTETACKRTPGKPGLQLI